MKKNISETVRELIAPTVQDLGYRIWDITFGKIGADYHLEITIDADSGIGIEDCEKVHRAIDPILDESDPIEGFYYLEVSSPGLERELRTEEHIRLSLGKKVEAKLYKAKDGRKSVCGTLADFNGDVIVIVEENGAPASLPQSEIAKLSTYYGEEDEAVDIHAAKETEKQ